jgi:hypothetical protein
MITTPVSNPHSYCHARHCSALHAVRAARFEHCLPLIAVNRGDHVLIRGAYSPTMHRGQLAVRLALLQRQSSFHQYGGQRIPARRGFIVMHRRLSRLGVLSVLLSYRKLSTRAISHGLAAKFQRGPNRSGRGQKIGRNPGAHPVWMRPL